MEESSGNFLGLALIHVPNQQSCSRRCKCRSPHWHRPTHKLLRPIELDVPPPDIEKFQERSADHHSSTYSASGVGVEGRVMDDKSSVLNVDCPSELKVGCPAPGHRAKNQESSGTFWRRPALIHLHFQRCWCRRSSHGRQEFHPECRWLPRTESCMWGPGNWSTKKVQERSADQHSSTYLSGGVALEGASVDLHLGAVRINCSALLSWMSGPRTWRKVQEISVSSFPENARVGLKSSAKES